MRAGEGHAVGVGGAYVGGEADGGFRDAAQNAFVESDEGPAEDEEDVGCVNDVLFDFACGRGRRLGG